jgi:hypothetical protein
MVGHVTLSTLVSYHHFLLAVTAALSDSDGVNTTYGDGVFSIYSSHPLAFLSSVNAMSLITKETSSLLLVSDFSPLLPT